MREECKQRIIDECRGLGEHPENPACKAKDLGLNSLLDCRPALATEEDPSFCRFAIPFGKGYFCKCPLALLRANKT